MLSFARNIFIITLLLLLAILNSCYAINPNKYVSNTANESNFFSFGLPTGKVASILISDTDFPGVLRVVGHLQNDIHSVTNISPTIIKNKSLAENYVVIIGTLGKKSNH